MTDDPADPNEAYEVHPRPKVTHGPEGWWMVTKNGVEVWFAHSKEECEKIATDPEERRKRRNVKKAWEK